MADMPGGKGEDNDTIKPYDHLIRATSVSSEQPIMMVATNRWAYFNKYLERFQEMITYETNVYVLGGIGVLLLLMGNLLSIVFLAGGAYYWPLYQRRKQEVNSQRRVIIGH